MEQKKTLCGLCAVRLRDQGFQLTQVGGRTDKISCEHCGKRRYGTEYAVIAPEPKKRGRAKADG